eukprot:1506098-Rhodomonas_salina.2
MMIKVKHGPSNEIIKFKARVVVQGFRHRQGLDYGMSYAPVANATVVRVALAIGAYLDLDIEHVDFTQAFLNASLNKELYVSLPPGAPLLPPCKAWRLLLALYGTIQAPRAWHLEVKRHINTWGFQDAGFEGTVYIKQEEDGTYMMLVLYVNDLLIFHNNKAKSEDFKDYLHQKYKLTDEGDLKWHLGICYALDRENKVIYCNQETAIDKLLEKQGFRWCNLKHTLMTPGVHLTADDCPAEVDEARAKWYQEVVGVLWHLADFTRPDLQYTTSELARFSANPRPSHEEAVKHTLRYLA